MWKRSVVLGLVASLVVSIPASAAAPTAEQYRDALSLRDRASG